MRLIKHKAKTYKRKENKKHVKDNIKKATAELLAEKGYASISTRDIAKRADTALGQLTYYYKTKDALILEVIDEIIDEFISEIEQIADTSDNRIEDLRKYLNNIIDDDYMKSRIIIDIISQSLYNNALSTKANEMINKMSNIFTKVIIEENIEIDEAKSESYINYFLGTMIRKNIEQKAIDNEKYAFNEAKSNKIKQKSLSAQIV